MDRVSELVALCLEHLSLNGEDVLGDLCAQHPDQAEELRLRMDRLAALGLVGGGGDSSQPQRVGPFGIAGLLGQGGMGRVFLGQQTAPVRRVVAVKLMHAGVSSEGLLQRFDAERQALAVLSHPGIAQVLEAGATDDGQPWYAMEFVDGVPITAWCDAADATVDQRIDLFLQLCDAVTHAHHNGILHRDLKPSNVLVCERDGRPLVKVIDFGLAKALAEDAPLLTRAGQVVGTPAYMSPEQAGVSRQVVDTRSDQYALGVLLYELLTGELPLEPAGDRADTLLAMQELLRDAEPPGLSRRVASRDPSLARKLRGDLEWIVAKALRKDRDARYGSVAQFAEDLRHHQRLEPVAAGPESTVYRLSRLLRRHRREAAVALVAMLGLLASFTYIAWQGVERGRQLEAFDLLALPDTLADLRLRAGLVLWPEVPERIPAMDEWLRDAEAVLATVPEHRATLAGLESRGTLVGDHWTFENLRDGVLHREAGELIPAVLALGEPGGLIDEVRDRRDWAAGLEQLTLIDAADAWATARDAIASHPAYEGLDLPPQLGLLPLGPDPESGLWEFALPRRDEQLPQRHPDDQRYVIADDTCIVLVLIPGGTFARGAQSEDPAAPGYLAQPAELELGGGQVTLAPFLIGKYELTQGQWSRAAGANPSRYASRDDRPVEQVTWSDCLRVLARLDLQLPTGAQWERAARGGKPWPWWTDGSGVPVEWSANLADEKARAKLGATPGIAFQDGYSDGATAHNVVGTYLPNPYGLHDVIGNVWEWCRDPGLHYTEASTRPGDGLQIPLEALDEDGLGREMRGGSFLSNWSTSRSTYRLFQPRNSVNNVLGVRPARSIAGLADEGLPP